MQTDFLVANILLYIDRFLLALFQNQDPKNKQKKEERARRINAKRNAKRPIHALPFGRRPAAGILQTTARRTLGMTQRYVQLIRGRRAFQHCVDASRDP